MALDPRQDRNSSRIEPGQTAYRRGDDVVSTYQITPAAALVGVAVSEIRGAALRACYRGGRWFESTAVHHG
jgi:hypothetical protein